MRVACVALAAVALALGLPATGLRGDESSLKTIPDDKAEKTTHCHGTAIEFVATPADAAKRAAEEKKLVVVLHVSGYFEDSSFT
jgi:hypothetical protein